jgi:hypothetical protein
MTTPCSTSAASTAAWSAACVAGAVTGVLLGLRPVVTLEAVATAAGLLALAVVACAWLLRSAEA